MKVIVKNMKQIGILLTVLLMLCNPIMVSAEENNDTTKNAIENLEMFHLEEADIEEGKQIVPKALLYNCLIIVNCSSDGMRVTFSTDSSQLASSVGVKDVVIKQKVWYGWKTVATSVGSFYTNNYGYTGTILYTNAIKGEEYRITCTHYADADEYTEVHGELDVVFTY